MIWALKLIHLNSVRARAVFGCANFRIIRADTGKNPGQVGNIRLEFSRGAFDCFEDTEE